MKHSALNGLLEAQGSMGKRRQKDRKNQRSWVTPRKWCMNSQRLTACTKPELIHARQNPSTEKGEKTQSPTPPPIRKLFALISARRGKMTFLQESDTEYVNHTPMEACAQELLTNTKQTPRSVHVCVCFMCCCCCCYSLVLLSFGGCFVNFWFVSVWRKEKM